MFEARLVQGNLLKKLIEAVRELVTDANLECSEDRIELQAMDSSHVSLCALVLRCDGFNYYRCDKNVSLGMNLQNLAKILKCAGNDDTITLRAGDTAEVLSLMFENEKQDRVSDFEMKLMDIDSEHLGIPDQQYSCTIRMPSGEFQRLMRDLSMFGDTCVISCSKEGLKFSVTGDLGTGNVTLRQNQAVDNENDAVLINMNEPVQLSFAIRYLTMFTKATPLGPTVSLSMSKDIPILVEYPIDTFGYVRYFLAPKIEEGN